MLRVRPARAAMFTVPVVAVRVEVPGPCGCQTGGPAGGESGLRGREGTGKFVNLGEEME